jgi:hypothetical protein
MSITRPEPPGTGQPGTGELARQVLDRTIALCGIPAPPRHEQQRAEVVLGIPALTLGITTGEGTHTEQEWIDAGPVAAGLAALAATVARLDEQEW